MAFLRPPDPPGVVYEFFAPFAHVEGRFEWCRVRSPTHGVFDLFIALDPRGTSQPADVYALEGAGQRFLAERYPECARHRATLLTLDEKDGGRTVAGFLAAREGPLCEAAMTFTAPEGVPEQVPYGGEGTPVWGSARFTCWGVDLVLRGRAKGHVKRADGRVEVVDDAGIVTLGSFGRIAPMA